MRFMLEKFILIILIFAAGVLSGCKNGEEIPENRLQTPDGKKALAAEQAYVEKALHTLRIGNIKATDDSVLQFKVKVETPDPCWTFLRYEYEKKGEDLLFTIIGRREKATACIQMIGTLETDISISLPAEGTYNCRFWCRNGETLDTTVVLPFSKR